MNIISLGFLLFLAAALVLYYRLPERGKPYVLLAASFFFIGTYDLRGILFLLATALVVWYVGLGLARQARSGQDPKALKAGKRRVLTLGIVITAGVLVVLKYLGPITAGLLAPSRAVRFFVPIGLSYYTLMAISYMVDVYWGRIQPESRYRNLLLYLCYFPHILQGPIGRYGELRRELFEKEHPFSIHNLKYGVQMILWGYFKLLVIGEKTHFFVVDAFHSGKTAYGFAALFGLMMFGFDLYANFSGGIDVIRGVSQCFGIELQKNFSQPFFSRSLGEFWRRWHITLGTWMKDYVFFPISMSRPFSRLKKSLKKKVNKKLATRIPIALANILVFMLVGVWHGLGGNYLLWGLYNGLILAFSEVMAEAYLRAKGKLHIRDDSRLWAAFSLVRTFLIITIGWATDCASTAAGSFQIFFNMLNLGMTDFGIFQSTLIGYAKAFFGIFILVAVDICHEKGISVRDSVNARNALFQILFWTALIQLIALLGRTATLGGLMYAGF